MRKTDKKIDNQLRLVLTDVCETALKDISGFQWLTHVVNYSNFPQSLRVVCVFDSDENLTRFISRGENDALASMIQKKLLNIGVTLSDRTAQIIYDSEETCQLEHKGSWSERLKIAAYLTH